MDASSHQGAATCGSGRDDRLKAALQRRRQQRLPDWLRMPLPRVPAFSMTRSLIEDLRLHTVCESAKCPNQWECWSKGTATFMIAGDRCTRACGFCAVDTRRPMALEADEPERVAEATRRMGLRHVVITAVARDDLADGGAAHFHQTIRAVREKNPEIVIEVLTPDFLGDLDAIRWVLDAGPEIFNHNLETVRRLTPTVRSRATYDQSLQVLRTVRELVGSRIYTKSGLMLGLGESDDEVRQAMQDLRAVDCDILTMGQYLQPTLKHLPVEAYVTPEQFEAFKNEAEAMGFLQVASGPLVRSSYHAEDVASLLPSRD